jgi:hypothetical protein
MIVRFEAKLSLVANLFLFSNEATDRTVIRSFALRREKTTRKLFLLPVISDALTTFSLAVTGVVCAGALGFVLF